MTGGENGLQGIPRPWFTSDWSFHLFTIVAVALGMAFGPSAGLDVVDGLMGEPSLAAYHLLPSVRGDLLRKLGRLAEARAEFDRLTGRYLEFTTVEPPAAANRARKP